MIKFFTTLLMVLTAGSTAWAEESPARLLVFGDSLVAGYGLPQGVAFPDQLAASLHDDGVQVEVINGGISGDTTAGGASRIEWSLADAPDAVLVVLGGNDALRGLAANDMKANLDVIISAVQRRGIPMILAGMHAPANMGGSYGNAFDQAFLSAVAAGQARRPAVLFYPFFLDGVALDPNLNQYDGIHPNEAGVAEIVRRIRPMVDELLQLVPKQ